MSISTDDLGRITQQTDVIGADGDKLGSIHQVYTSDTTGDPAWVTVKTGLFGTQESFVPLSDASFDGEDIRVGVTKDAVSGAPRVDTDGHLSPEEEDELYRYYGLHNPDQGDVPDDGRVGDDRSGFGDDRSDLGDDRSGDATTAGAAAAAGGGLAAGSAGRDDRDRDDRSGLGDDRVGNGRSGLGDDRVGDGRSGLGDDRVGDDRDDRPGLGDRSDRDDDGAGRTAAAAGAGGAAGTALGGGFGRERSDDDQAGAGTAPEQAATDDRSVAAENGPEHVEQAGPTQQAGTGDGDDRGQEAVRPGERTTRLRRYVVTERVVQTIEELPDEDGSAR